MLLTVKEAAERLKVSLSFVYDLLAKGELNHYVLGRGSGGKRISEEQLQAYLAAKERGGKQEAPSPAPKSTAASGFTILDGQRLREAWQGH